MIDPICIYFKILYVSLLKIRPGKKSNDLMTCMTFPLFLPNILDFLVFLEIVLLYLYALRVHAYTHLSQYESYIPDMR